MNDNSVIIRKYNGESVILNQDDSVDYIDSDGNVLGRDDATNKVSYRFHQILDINNSHTPK